MLSALISAQLKFSPMLRGALAASVTPLRDGGESLDEEAFPPYAEFLRDGGLDGLLALGTTGEGVLLSLEERKRAAELFVAGELPVVVHAGAQSTADTVALAEHAAAAGAAGVAVIGPPYYPLDAEALLAHFAAAAGACAPLPFYVYEFEARSGYAVPIEVVERLRATAPNLAGLKVSDRPFERVRPYLLEGLAVFVGAEPLLPEAIASGAVGTVSGLAAAFPAEVAALVREPGDPERLERVDSLRRLLDRFPFQAAAKGALGLRGVPVRPDVRAPLRPLSNGERTALARELEGMVG
jgi:dihydrodipicolinate synthase/N-acetylneuraminate lyase